ncbi:hypothetical protein EDD80_10493 [Anseongella ginsenosidimutans]|uniref:Uncharacterized protein n=1 Tax=Anseongella ginsenosidimutans TaxID=496056 RepID=A0A4R3KSI6_9SPHI|nr:hypothetical protein [Anseongella ginsenosidimutans]QEC53126.1 hypothetical protein FRZ59_12780 [Anseongella ginsenosidimutans]TCS87746.1 hypothetical protein EDD80_10493 [Anseongella ginsenosidimutans]
MKKGLLALFFMVLSANLARAQSVDERRMNLIKGFLHDMHETEMDAREIGEKYIWFGQARDTEMSEKHERLKQHLEYLRAGAKDCVNCEECQNCKIIFKETQHKIIPYTDLSEIPHVNFDRAEEEIKDNIYVLAEGQKALQYFYLRDGKIASFYYVEKGGTPFFLMY